MGHPNEPRNSETKNPVIKNLRRLPLRRFFCTIIWNFHLFFLSLPTQCRKTCHNMIRAEHYIMEKRHTMLCRLAGWNYHSQLQVKDNAEYDATGMLKMYPVVCLRANHAFTAHLRVYQQYVAWVSLCSSTCKGCGRPQSADEQKVDTRVFCCVVN